MRFLTQGMVVCQDLDPEPKPQYRNLKPLLQGMVVRQDLDPDT